MCKSKLLNLSFLNIAFFQGLYIYESMTDIFANFTEYVMLDGELDTEKCRHDSHISTALCESFGALSHSST